MRKSEQIKFWRELDLELAQKPWHDGDHLYSAKDCERISNAFVLTANVIYDLLGSTRFQRDVSLANLTIWLRSLSSWDLPIIVSTAKEMVSLLRLAMDARNELSSRQIVSSFKQTLSSAGAVLKAWQPLLGFVYSYLRDPANESDFWVLNTCLSFVLRLTLKDVDWIEDAEMHKYLEFQSSGTRLQEEDPTTSKYISLVREEVCAMLADVDKTIYQFTPFLSNGATREVRRGEGKQAKWKVMEQQCSDTLRWPGHPLRGGLPMLMFTVNEHESVPVNATYQLVPKGIDKKRGISMEPTLRQYLNTMVSQALDHHFQKHPEYGINLHNQELSRNMALQASGTHKWATYDLSAASDSVSARLFVLLTENLWGLNKYILSLRSTCNTIDGEDGIPLTTLSPMGSCVCFPVECIVFAGICRAACRLAKCKLDYRVYGDDILIPTEAEYVLRDILTTLGFSVNVDKSYGDQTSFREACGIEALNGRNVTPVRLSRQFDVIAVRACQPTAVCGAIEFVNTLYEHGLFNTRRYVLSLLRDSKILSRLPFGYSEGIHSWYPHNSHLRVVSKRLVSTRCRDTNGKRVKKWMPLPEPCYAIAAMQVRSARGEEKYRYIEYLNEAARTRRSSLSDPEDRIDVRVGRSSTPRWRTALSPISLFTS